MLTACTQKNKRKEPWLVKSSQPCSLLLFLCYNWNHIAKNALQREWGNFPFANWSGICWGLPLLLVNSRFSKFTMGIWLYEWLRGQNFETAAQKIIIWKFWGNIFTVCFYFDRQMTVRIIEPQFKKEREFQKFIKRSSHSQIVIVNIEKFEFKSTTIR